MGRAARPRGWRTLLVTCALAAAAISGLARVCAQDDTIPADTGSTTGQVPAGFCRNCANQSNTTNLGGGLGANDTSVSKSACEILAEPPAQALLEAACGQGNCTYLPLYIGALVDLTKPANQFGSANGGSLNTSAGGEDTQGLSGLRISAGERQCRSWLLWRNRLIALYGGIPTREDSEVYIIPVFGIVNIDTGNPANQGGSERLRETVTYLETIKMIDGTYQGFAPSLIFASVLSDNTAAAALAALEGGNVPVITGSSNGPQTYQCPYTPDNIELLSQINQIYPPCTEMTLGLRRFQNLYSTTSWDSVSFLPFIGQVVTFISPANALIFDRCAGSGPKVIILYEEEPYLSALAREVITNQRFFSWQAFSQVIDKDDDMNTIVGVMESLSDYEADVFIGAISSSLCRTFLDAFDIYSENVGEVPKALCLTSCFDSPSSSYRLGENSRWIAGVSTWNPHVTGDAYSERLINPYRPDGYGLPLFFKEADNLLEARNIPTDSYVPRPSSFIFQDLFASIELDLLLSRAAFAKCEYRLPELDPTRKDDFVSQADAEEADTAAMTFSSVYWNAFQVLPSSQDASYMAMGYMVAQAMQFIVTEWSQSNEAQSYEALQVSAQDIELWQRTMKRVHFRSFYGVMNVDALGENSGNQMLTVQEDFNGEVQIVEPAAYRTAEFVFPIPPLNDTIRNYPCPPGKYVKGANRWCTTSEIVLSPDDCSVAIYSEEAAFAANFSGEVDSAFPMWFNTTCANCPQGKISNENGSLECTMCPPNSYANAGNTECIQKHVFTSWQIAVLAVMISLIVFGAGYSWLWWTRSGHFLRMQEERKKRYPPKPGEPCTHVVTDIEGSTRLWEANPELMGQALEIHHRVIRYTIEKFFGFELDTEGDSFHIIFHNPTDATTFAVALQEELMNQDWPEDLLAFECARTIDKAEPVPHLIFNGLRVRAGIAHGENLTEELGNENGDGVQEKLKKSGNDSIHLHRRGNTPKYCKALCAQASSGGQILISKSAADLLQSKKLPDVTCLCMGVQVVDETLPPVEIFQVLKLRLASRLRYFAPMIPVMKLELPFYEAPGATFAVAFLEDVKAQARMSGLSSNVGKSAAKAGKDFFKSAKAKVRTLNFSRADTGVSERSNEPSEHSYVDGHSSDDTGAISPTTASFTIVFIQIDGGTRLFDSNPELAEETMKLLELEMRTIVVKHGGYISEVKDGDFLLAFESPRSAILCCLEAQEEALHWRWSPDLLELDMGSVIYAASFYDNLEEGQSIRSVNITTRAKQLLFRGLRMRMGISQGACHSIRPHRKTGRIAYFGKVLNRSARIMALAAGGQVLLDRPTLELAMSADLMSSNDLKEGIVRTDIGYVPLKGISDRAAQHIVQVSTTRLADRQFPEILGRTYSRDNDDSLGPAEDSLVRNGDALVKSSMSMIAKAKTITVNPLMSLSSRLSARGAHGGRGTGSLSSHATSSSKE